MPRTRRPYGTAVPLRRYARTFPLPAYEPTTGRPPNDMPAFRRRKGSLPRLVPELDDVTLGRVRRRVETCWSRGSLDTAVMALMADAINEAGEDWDRKAHRLGVLAGSAGRSLPGIWRQHSPKDHGALLLHAWSDLLHARQQDAGVDLDATRETCRLAAELIPADPTPWTVHLAILRVEQRPSTELSAIWREIKARDPWNREAHLQALGYLSPDECGSSALVLDLLDGVRSAMPPMPPPPDWNSPRSSSATSERSPRAA